jgi:hypothetical protein
MVARARGSGHSFSRRFDSKATPTPRARAVPNACSTASQAPADSARLMPEASTIRVRSARPSGMSAGVIRLAAEPARRYENAWPAGPWVTK